MKIGVFLIGIESQGDPGGHPSRLEKSIQEFVALNCDVILCATRTEGSTVKLVENLRNSGYHKIIWRDRIKCPSKAKSSLHDAVNRKEAKEIVRQIEVLIDGNATPLLAAI